MNKKIIGVIIAAIVVLLVIAFVVMTLGRKNGGLDASIQNEQNKQAKMASTTSGRVLVVYFSDTGNTQKLAKIISDQVGGDLKMIEPKVAYPTGRELYDYTKRERDNDERPEFKDLGINLEDYDTIFVGYPMWWYTLPMIMYTFFDTYDFAGKTIVPFNTHEGSGDGGTYTTIKQWEPNATVLDGLAIRGGDMSKDQTTRVASWLKELGYTEV